MPDQLDGVLDRDQARLYRLIWQRTVASQMAEARFDQVSVDIAARTPASDSPTAPPYLLRATGQTLKFDGFRRVYFEGRDDALDEDAESMLPALTAEQALRLLELLPEQHFTQPPPRYSEASLVKTLEENGIGRPSTYAPIIRTLLDRGYVRLEDKRFFPEDIGMVVSDILVDLFPRHRRRRVHGAHGGGARRHRRGPGAVGRRCSASSTTRSTSTVEIVREGKKIQPPAIYLDEMCPLCPEEGREPGQLVKKLGRYGMFVGCENYPECKFTRPLEGEAQGPAPVPTGETCPQCGEGELVERMGRYGKFVGCARLPGLQVHQEGRTEAHGREVSEVRPGRAGRAHEPVRPAVLLVRAVPGLRLRREPEAAARSPARRAAAWSSPPAAARGAARTATERGTPTARSCRRRRRRP